MLKAQDIINGLQGIADKFSGLALLWHLLFYTLIIALIAGWVPSARLLAILISLPLLSVATLALISGNPFNGTIFLVIFILNCIFGLNADLQPATVSQPVFLVPGAVMIGFGLMYPHFVERSFIKYLSVSPAGLIPCPTLSVLIGFALIFNGFGSPSMLLVLILSGLFYGIFGVLKLAVYADLFLIIGSIALFVRYLILF